MPKEMPMSTQGDYRTEDTPESAEGARRATGETFIERYNAHWRVERFGFLNPDSGTLRQALAAA